MTQLKAKDHELPFTCKEFTYNTDEFPIKYAFKKIISILKEKTSTKKCIIAVNIEINHNFDYTEFC